MNAFYFYTSILFLKAAWIALFSFQFPVILKSYYYSRSQEDTTVINLLSCFFFRNTILPLSLW